MDNEFDLKTAQKFMRKAKIKKIIVFSVFGAFLLAILITFIIYILNATGLVIK
ncbi:hypothetical protein [Metamycoplasma hyosynoviae]|uniref:hypothetical protein n=1 Tax=Metamycoplasma hyosynoviae TaxID=29559 RepID=UPI000B0F9C2D|nr:hypothetical protein [Metamycoplasma hyosynoviae]MDC8900933.1 hypothetical protein [Metamycoplasma hyosynoviae]MDC8911449.1 hypothetical protein [Metamycoplasma hyosynoviae]MDC8912383.1 hypothetical protein [Metamycoplasma hyosynoviae]MDC8912775.1 hypothetical protein [Metamycoplasma hyosynoviae]MDC8913615.1 hypothetical protein [Metamycoplasma hyosynoviae]